MEWGYFDKNFVSVLKVKLYKFETHSSDYCFTVGSTEHHCEHVTNAVGVLLLVDEKLFKICK